MPDLHPLKIRTKYAPTLQPHITRSILISKHSTTAQIYAYIQRVFSIPEVTSFEIRGCSGANNNGQVLCRDGRSLESCGINADSDYSLVIKPAQSNKTGSIPEEAMEEEKENKTAANWQEKYQNRQLAIMPNPGSNNQQANVGCNTGMTEEEQMQLALAMSLEQTSEIGPLPASVEIEPISGMNGACKRNSHI